MSTPDMIAWQGRVDAADGPRALRWHQVIQPVTPGCHPGLALIGFTCDEGVRRNGGRVGARDGPATLRGSLANLAWHQTGPLYDAGDVDCPDGDLECAQTRLTEVVAGSIQAGHRTLILGGGHETAWGTFQGITTAEPAATIGVINIDAHFDLRADLASTSGTPFRQIANWCTTNNRPFRYLCLGIAEPNNTAALFDRANELGATYLLDVNLVAGRLAAAMAMIDGFAASVDRLHLSVDLDVLPGAVMPAVSAPAGRGVALDVVEVLIAGALATHKVAAVDVVEFNPRLDPAGTATRVAAGLVWRVAKDWV